HAHEDDQKIKKTPEENAPAQGKPSCFSLIEGRKHIIEYPMVFLFKATKLLPEIKAGLPPKSDKPVSFFNTRPSVAGQVVQANSWQ
ncbi:MAG: hypothetical protein KDC70_19990, partial [Saprospiraceae bacterium]|nr:hypothetical protein [Saprospiraceae bacterium]